MPTHTEYELAKAQVGSFSEKGYLVKFEMQPMINEAAPKIVIMKGVKQWRFCDPDWTIVNRQLTQLYKTLEGVK